MMIMCDGGADDGVEAVSCVNVGLSGKQAES